MKKNLLLLLVSASTLSLASCSMGGITPSTENSQASNPTLESSKVEEASQASSQASENSQNVESSQGSGELVRNAHASAWKLPDTGFDTNQEVEINFYHTMGKSLQPILQTYLEDFKTLYPNITVVETSVGSYDAVLSQISTELSTGLGPDIAYCYADHVALYNKTKTVVTLDNLMDDPEYGLTDDEYEDFVPGYLAEGASFGDNLYYTLPWSKSTEILYYNKDVFEENNLAVPTHWFSESASDTTSMEFVCKVLKEKYPESTPLGYDSEANWFITMCEQYQSGYTSASGNHFLFDNDVNRGFVEKFNSWKEKGWVTTQGIYGTYTSGLFIETSAAARSFMSIGSSAGATHQIPTATTTDNVKTYPFEVGMATIPQVNQNNKKVISQGPSVCLFRHGDKQKVLASWLFAKYFTTNVAFQAEFSINSGYVPVIKSVTENPIYAAHLAKADSPLLQDVTEVDGYWAVKGVKTSEKVLVAKKNAAENNALYWFDGETPTTKCADGVTEGAKNNPGVDQSARASAYSAKLCSTQVDYYYTSPSFVGSSKAREQVGKIITQVLTGQSTIDQAFKDAVANCEADIA